MPVRNFDRYESKELWYVLVEDKDNPKVYYEQVEYFTTEKSAMNWLNKNKVKKYIISQEAF